MSTTKTRGEFGGLHMHTSLGCAAWGCFPWFTAAVFDLYTRAVPTIVLDIAPYTAAAGAAVGFGLMTPRLATYLFLRHARRHNRDMTASYRRTDGI